jgi:alpha-glucosidase
MSLSAPESPGSTDSAPTVTGDPATGIVPPWWSRAVFYQVYVRSFADSDGDGIGDLDGLRAHLDHLVDLGVDALWLNPIYRSPMADHGYDVADPRDIDPMFGGLAAFDRLIPALKERGIKLTMDLVPNHVSDQHPWFQAALSAGPGSPERARFHFADGLGPDGSQPPNNWPSIFGGPAWTRVPDGQWYLHLFAPEQPDLNWAHPDVVADLVETLRFWLDRGVDGFRIDVAMGMAKPAGLPDLPEPHLLEIAELGHEAPHDTRFDNDEVHAYHRIVRSVLDSYDDRMAVGEVWVSSDERRALYVRPDELHLAFNFSLTTCPWDATELRATIDSSLAAMAGVGAPTTWTLSNHDVSRQVTRYGGGEPGVRRARAAIVLELALPGVVYLYNGEELGLGDVDLPDWALQDPVWERSGRTRRGRDGCRVPLPWSGGRPPYGFAPEGATTWLPMPDGWAGLTVAAQRDDPDSMLSLYRNGLALRRTTIDPETPLAWRDAPPGCVAFRRGDLECWVNVSAEPVPLPPGDVVLASTPLDGPLPPDAAAWIRVR